MRRWIYCVVLLLIASGSAFAAIVFHPYWIAGFVLAMMGVLLIPELPKD